MIFHCPYCSPDTAGNHEHGCPALRTVETTSAPSAFKVMYVSVKISPEMLAFIESLEPLRKRAERRSRRLLRKLAAQVDADAMGGQ